MLPETVERTVREHQLAPAGARWVVAVSGGADSVALLHALLQLQPRFGYHLHVATLDHKLRVPEGAQDVRFVCQISDEWGVTCTPGRVDVPALAAEQRLSLEAAARLARYHFLTDVARSVGATHIATAHNADDQAETVLMHVLRGAGLAGLSGMRFAAPMFDAPELTLIRPLLAVPRADVEAYCQANGLAFRTDATNADRLFLRNRLRHEVLPLLRQINPQVSRQLRQLAEASAVDADYIEEAFQRQVIPLVTTGERVMLPLAAFRAAHPALQRRFVVWAARQLVPGVELAYVQQVESGTVAAAGRVGAQVTLPAGLRLRVDYGAVVVERAGDTLPDASGFWLAPGTVLEVAVPGLTAAGGWAVEAVPAVGRVADAQATLAIPVGARVRLRTRQPGDRFEPPGLGGHHQKLKEWLIDHKVPQHQRDRLPLLEVDGELAALVLGARWPVSSRFAVDSANERKVAFYAQLNA